MALDGSKTLKPSGIGFYVASVGEAAPADLSASIAGNWENVGHTSLTNLLAFDTEGGEITTLGSAQDPALRQSVTAAIRSFTANLLQWDTASLKLFFGQGAKVTGKKVEVPSTPVPEEKALLVVIEDGASRFGIHAEKASIIGDGNISIDDMDSLAQLPLRFTPLAHNNKAPFTLITI